MLSIAMIPRQPRRWSERHWRVKDAGKQGLAADDAGRIDVLHIAVPRQFLNDTDVVTAVQILRPAVMSTVSSQGHEIVDMRLREADYWTH